MKLTFADHQIFPDYIDINCKNSFTEQFKQTKHPTYVSALIYEYKSNYNPKAILRNVCFQNINDNKHCNSCQKYESNGTIIKRLALWHGCFV